MIELLTILIIGASIITELILIIFFLYNFKTYNKPLENFPKIAILVAARNEEANIKNCLNALLSLKYPTNKLEIWVGDDASSDTTWQIIQEYSQKHPIIKSLQITKNTTSANGKANVLAQLAHASKGDWIFITDADIQVPKQWLTNMLAAVKNKDAALITGISLVTGKKKLDKMQHLDWLYATSMLKVISDIGIPITTMGNNMAIKRTAYEEVGGFESLPFSITEDLELFKQIKKKYKTINLFSKEVLNKSAPQKSVRDLLIQRKRWMKGAFELPFQILAILLIQAFYIPVVILLIIINPIIGVFLWCIKWILKFIFVKLAAQKLKEKISTFDSLILEFFGIFFSLASMAYYLWPSKVHWKGRLYK